MTALAGIALCLLPLTVAAAPKKTARATPARKTSAATLYECGKCRMRVSAAVAKKDGYKDPMDGGRFAPVRPARK